MEDGENMASAETPIEKKHKKVRRGNKGKDRSGNGIDEISVIHMNIRGIKSKVRDIIQPVHKLLYENRTIPRNDS